MNKLEELALEIARSEFADREFITTELWEKLKAKWVFRLPKGKVFHVLEGLAQKGHLNARKEYLEKWRKSSTSYRYLWRVI